MNNFYALLVGIDNYPDPAIRLYGCVNDIKAVEEYLRERFVPGQDPARIKILTDAAAARQNVIGTFQQHLGQAQAGDTALFYYAGHGSQEQAPPEFWTIEPDHKNETLVCYDSRTPGGWDLADKELAVLLQQVSSKGVHLAVVLDCCHSGSGTRDLFKDGAERRAPPDTRLRPLTAYLPAVQQSAAEIAAGGSAGGATTGTRGLDRPPSGWQTVKQTRHVLLAACRDDQTAKEYSPQGVRHGALTYFLLDTLTSANGPLTYEEIYKRVSSLISANVIAQNPQLEATDSSDLSKVFLLGQPKPRGEFFTASCRAGAWSIDGGSLHGIPKPNNGETVSLALFPLTAAADDLRDLSKSLTTATIASVASTSSAIALADASKLEKQSVYKAVVTALPLPRMPVLLEGDDAGKQMIREAIAGSLYVAEAESNATFRAIARNGQFIIARPGNDRPLVAQLSMQAGNAKNVVSSLENIARWTSLANLKNNLSQISEKDYKLSLIKNKGTMEELTGADLELHYKPGAEGKLDYPTFWIRVQNLGTRPLYFALMVLSEMFGISTDLLPEGTRRLNPSEDLWALGGEPVYANIPEPLLALGVTQSRDIVKLLVATGPFDAHLLEQQEQEGPVPATRGLMPVDVSGTLNRLMSRVQTRSLGGAPGGATQSLDDFTTATISITTIRPRDASSISAAAPADLGNGVVIGPHPSLQAQARLTTMPQVERDLGNLIMPAIFRDDTAPDAPQPLTFSNARGSDPGLSVLELAPLDSQPINHTAVTPENPLRVRIDIPFEEDAEILPFAFDGQFFLPLGHAVSENGKLVAELHRLPNPVQYLERSLTGSIRILFQKLVAKPLGFHYAYPILAVATRNEAGRVAYEADPQAMKKAVAAADHVLVCIHGIIGDTRAMAAGVLAGNPKDLVLTFDYENINTTIEENAQLLKDRLADVGLVANHGKTVRIVAHSMGGLISRWFIEQLGGNDVVQSLVALGTPHDGSPWPTVEGFVAALTSLALNNLAAAWLPAKALGLVLHQARKLNKALPELAPGSMIVNALSQTGDPKLPYILLVGNTADIHTPPPPPGDPWYQRLIESISISDLLHRVLSVAFLQEPNDIAVSVKSGSKVAANRQPAPVIHEVACDHLTYFSNPAGVSMLWQVLGIGAPAGAPQTRPKEN